MPQIGDANASTVSLECKDDDSPPVCLVALVNSKAISKVNDPIGNDDTVFELRTSNKYHKAANLTRVDDYSASKTMKQASNKFVNHNRVTEVESSPCSDQTHESLNSSCETPRTGEQLTNNYRTEYLNLGVEVSLGLELNVSCAGSRISAAGQGKSEYFSPEAIELNAPNSNDVTINTSNNIDVGKKSSYSPLYNKGNPSGHTTVMNANTKLVVSHQECSVSHVDDDLDLDEAPLTVDLQTDGDVTANNSLEQKRDLKDLTESRVTAPVPIIEPRCTISGSPVVTVSPISTTSVSYDVGKPLTAMDCPHASTPIALATVAPIRMLPIEPGYYSSRDNLPMVSVSRPGQFNAIVNDSHGNASSTSASVFPLSIGQPLMSKSGSDLIVHKTKLNVSTPIVTSTPTSTITTTSISSLNTFGNSVFVNNKSSTITTPHNQNPPGIRNKPVGLGTATVTVAAVTAQCSVFPLLPLGAPSVHTSNAPFVTHNSAVQFMPFVPTGVAASASLPVSGPSSICLTNLVGSGSIVGAPSVTGNMGTVPPAPLQIFNMTPMPPFVGAPGIVLHPAGSVPNPANFQLAQNSHLLPNNNGLTGAAFNFIHPTQGFTPSIFPQPPPSITDFLIDSQNPLGPPHPTVIAPNSITLMGAGSNSNSSLSLSTIYPTYFHSACHALLSTNPTPTSSLGSITYRPHLVNGITNLVNATTPQMATSLVSGGGVGTAVTFQSMSNSTAPGFMLQTGAGQLLPTNFGSTNTSLFQSCQFPTLNNPFPNTESVCANTGIIPNMQSQHDLSRNLLHNVSIYSANTSNNISTDNCGTNISSAGYWPSSMPSTNTEMGLKHFTTTTTTISEYSDSVATCITSNIEALSVNCTIGSVNRLLIPQPITTRRAIITTTTTVLATAEPEAACISTKSDKQSPHSPNLSSRDKFLDVTKTVGLMYRTSVNLTPSIRRRRMFTQAGIKPITQLPISLQNSTDVAMHSSDLVDPVTTECFSKSQNTLDLCTSSPAVDTTGFNSVAPITSHKAQPRVRSPSIDHKLTYNNNNNKIDDSDINRIIAPSNSNIISCCMHVDRIDPPVSCVPESSDSCAQISSTLSVPNSFTVTHSVSDTTTAIPDCLTTTITTSPSTLSNQASDYLENKHGSSGPAKIDERCEAVSLPSKMDDLHSTHFEPLVPLTTESINTINGGCTVDSFSCKSATHLNIQFPPPIVHHGPDNRRILTHFIDGHIIYESDKPFPVKHGMSVVEAALLHQNVDLQTPPLSSSSPSSSSTTSPCSSSSIPSPDLLNPNHDISVRTMQVAIPADDDHNLSTLTNDSKQAETTTDVEIKLDDHTCPKNTSCRIDALTDTCKLQSQNKTAVFEDAELPDLPACSGENASHQIHLLTNNTDGSKSGTVITTRSCLGRDAYESRHSNVYPCNDNVGKQPIEPLAATMPVSTNITLSNSPVSMQRLSNHSSQTSATVNTCHQIPNQTLNQLQTPRGPIHEWTSNDVVAFVNSTPGCGAYASAFLANEIDGEALLLLAEDQFIQPPIGMKIGPALKLAARLESIRHCS